MDEVVVLDALITSLYGHMVLKFIPEYNLEDVVLNAESRVIDKEQAQIIPGGKAHSPQTVLRT